MLKKIFFIILSLNLLTHCDYKPLYSNQNNLNYKIVISSYTGDKYINNLLISNLKRNSRDQSDKKINLSFDTKYTKNILAKDSTGTITDYQSDVVITFVITKENISENFVVTEKFNFKKMTDKYEEKNYERNIMKNIANSISQKLILRLAVIE
jgi:hypothetical protein|tara:strand:+ start:106 stop:564 length:459 start_codon:yes stop_codon:yes gene_type:complete